MLAKSLNAPFHNISELTPAISLFKDVERRFARMGIDPDRSIDFEDSLQYQSYLQNYPLGLRRMTLLDVGRAYQVLFNQGVRKSIQLFSDEESDNELIYTSEGCDEVINALSATVRPGGTGTHFVRLLPDRKTFYAKTGTSDDAIHGWTVLSDGRLVIVAFVSYGAVLNGRLELNKTPSIPTGSGAQTAGVLAALLFNQLQETTDFSGANELLAIVR